MSYSIVLDGRMAEIMNEASERLGVDVETLGLMAISNFLNSPLVMNSLAIRLDERTEYLTRAESYVRTELPKASESNIQSAPDDMKNEQGGFKNSDIQSKDIKFDQIQTGQISQPEQDYVLWGQFSRFLTIKYTLRILAKLSQEKISVPLDTWFNSVRMNAANQRDVLREIDLTQKIPRGEQFASGFPKNGVKSLDRFVNHFCAAIYSDGEVVGFPSHLGLIQVSYSEGEKIVRLTEEGLEYVKLYNPIIDGSAPYESAMSEEEARFMLERINEHLPSTWGFFQYVIKSIDDGADTPSELSSAIDMAYGLGTQRNWNAAQVATYRSGALGLLGDCGIISRTWEFRSVTYSLTNKGKEVFV